jgi:outer membrane murein-binding lipoprotein Lpp
MHTRLVLLFGALGLCMCSGTSKSQAKAESSSSDVNLLARPRVDSLSKNLESAVIQHDTSTILAMLDPEYRAQELTKFHSGNPGPLLNSLFCGRVIGVDQYYCLDFQEISAIRNTGMELEEVSAKVRYIVKSSAHEIETSLTVTLQKGVVMGLIGSKGFTQVE